MIYGNQGYVTKDDVMKTIPDNVELYLLTEYGCNAIVSENLDYSIKESFRMYGVDLLHNTGFKYSLGYRFLDSCKLYSPGDEYVDVMLSLEKDPDTWNIWELSNNGYVEFGNNSQRPSRPTLYQQEGYSKPLSIFLQSLGGNKNTVIVQCCLPYITREYGWNKTELNYIKNEIKDMEQLGKYNLSMKQYNGNVQPHTREMSRVTNVQPFGEYQPEYNDQRVRDTGRGNSAAKDVLYKLKVINQFKSCRNNNKSPDCLESIKNYFTGLFTQPKPHAEGKKKKKSLKKKSLKKTSFKKKKSLKKKSFKKKKSLKKK